jgi:hypothetical protein
MNLSAHLCRFAIIPYIFPCISASVNLLHFVDTQTKTKSDKLDMFTSAMKTMTKGTLRIKLEKLKSKLTKLAKETARKDGDAHAKAMQEGSISSSSFAFQTCPTQRSGGCLQSLYVCTRETNQGRRSIARSQETGAR